MKRGMSKSAQTAIFIILAVVIVFILVVVFVRNQSSLSPELQVKVNSVKNEIEVCYEESIVSSLGVIGSQGGYFDKPKTEVYEKDEAAFLDFGPDFMPYYYYEGKVLFPSVRVVESELSKALEFNMNTCMFLVESEVDFSYGDIEIESKINDKNIVSDIKMNVIINAGESTIDLDINEKFEHESALGDILSLAIFMSESRVENPEEDCISCLAEMAKEDNIYMLVENFEEDSTIVGIYENYTSDNQEFVFLNKFGGGDGV